MAPKRKSNGGSPKSMALQADSVGFSSSIGSEDAAPAPYRVGGQVKQAKQSATSLPLQPVRVPYHRLGFSRGWELTILKPFLPLQTVPAVDSPNALPLLSASFSSLVSLIPPKFYLMREDDGGLSVGPNSQSRFHENAGNGALNKKEVAKAKRIAKLDPVNHVSVETAAALRARGGSSDEDEYEEDDSDNESLPFAVDDDDESDMEDPRIGKRNRPSESSGDDNTQDEMEALPNEGLATSVEDLKSRLQNRLAVLRKKRGVKDDSNESEAALAERKRRGEMRDRRRKERKEQRRAEKDPKEVKAAAAPAGNNKKPGDTNVRPQSGGRNTAPALLVPQPSKAEDEATRKVREAYEVDTSAVDVQYGGQVDEQVQKLAETHKLPRDPKTALAMFQARKEKAERKAEKKRAKLGDNYQAPTAADAAWEKATAAAAGVRVRDNEAMLKQAAERKDRAKAKGKAKWDERSQDVKDAQAARQAKREENIAIRQKSKKSRKPHPKDTRKTSSTSRPSPAGKAMSARKGMANTARSKFSGKGKNGRK